MAQPLHVLIASPLDPEEVRRIAAVGAAITVDHAPELLPAPRYPADHGGERPRLSAEDDDRWTALLAASDVAFDFDWRDPSALPRTAPRLRWVQATSAGIGGFVQRTGLDASGIRFTTAAGVHAVPLAEFALTGVLHFAKGVPLLSRRQRDRHWQRYATASVRGRRAVVVGLGSIGRETVALLAAAGLDVTGVGRPGGSRAAPGAARVVDTDALDDVLPDADVLVLAVPLTHATDGLIDRRRLGLVPDGAIVVNIARGQVIDQAALVDELAAERLGGAALDVFAVEPLPADSPLWAMDRVLVSPHSASTLPGENAAIVDLFVDNLRRFLEDRPLRNAYSAEAGY